MSRLAILLQEYLEMRTSCGFKVASTRKVLRRFVDFADQSGADTVTNDMFLKWRAGFGSAGPKTWSMRLGQVIMFARWLQAIDPSQEVPSRQLVSARYQRAKPFIYTQDQIAAILDAAAKLPSPNGIRSLTFPTMFGLLASTGMRVSEVIALDVGDVDLEAGVITVQRGKYGRERFVPLDNSVTEHLLQYSRRIDRLLGRRVGAFFVSDAGLRPSYNAVRWSFASACIAAGIRARPKNTRKTGSGPRIHDLRHTFAVRALTNWYRQGRDPSREMLKLSMYLGHERPSHTYWYIESVPELLVLASEKVVNVENGERQ